ncbi:MAG: hypothetical protein C0522_02475 [Rhodocyclaceae bacterium]|jgi:predicted lipoprotein with Yx(FWY)xxD motif|nr:hypothetical protein [Rhodocyclaceae bacterium]
MTQEGRRKPLLFSFTGSFPHTRNPSWAGINRARLLFTRRSIPIPTTFGKDAANSGKSMCNGQCAINWPPLFASDSDRSAGDWPIVTRDDGRKQWAYKGKPLYFWIKYQKPGDKTGDGVNNAWRMANE